jgi:hypothetical protein
MITCWLFEYSWISGPQVSLDRTAPPKAAPEVAVRSRAERADFPGRNLRSYHIQEIISEHAYVFSPAAYEILG